MKVSVVTIVVNVQRGWELVCEHSWACGECCIPNADFAFAIGERHQQVKEVVSNGFEALQAHMIGQSGA